MATKTIASSRHRSWPINPRGLAGCLVLLWLCASIARAAHPLPLSQSAQPRDHGPIGAGEGPVWHPAGDVYFTGGGRITRLKADGSPEVFRANAGGANGLLFDLEGRLVVCESANRRVTRTEADGSLTVLADSFDGKRFNTPNDLAIDSLGRIYFTDPRYGNRDGMEILDAQGKAIEGVYRIDQPGKVSRILTREVERPNGILVSPNDEFLYVADNNNNAVGGARKLWRFNLRSDGTVDPASRKLIYDWQDGRGPDGLEMDQAGRLYVAGGLNQPNPPFESAEKFKGGVYILSPDGELLGFVPVPNDEVTNCTFGGEDLRTLFITAGGHLWSVRVDTPGRLPFSAAFDLLIRGGRIVDGSGNPWFRGDLAIVGNRIAGVGTNLRGYARKELQADGLVVSPGFIDIHSHSDWVLLEDGSAQSKIRQGVTTEILGEGSSVAPFAGKLKPKVVTAQGREFVISSLPDYFRAVEANGISVNVASYVGIDNLWESVMGESFERPSAAQLDEMKSLLDQAMRAGALGLSSMIMMPPGSLATTDDLVQLCQVVKQHGGIYSTHIRNEGLGIFDSVTEAITVGERSGVPVDVIHLKIADQKYWGRMNEVVHLIEAARARGVNVQANVYPYTRGNNDLASIIPPWAHEGGSVEMINRLRNPSLRPRLKRDIQNGVDGWYNHYTAVGGDWSRMLVSANNRFKGMTMDRVMAQLKENEPSPRDPLDILFDLLIAEKGSVGTVYAHHTEEDMTLALAQPWCSVGSDGSAYAIDGPLRRGNPHPRNFGTFPRLLGVYVREKKLLRLEDAIRKITSLNAAKVGLRERGLLHAGFFADITLFNPALVLDKSDYTDPFHYNQGIEYVIVNGQVVLERGTHTGARPGKALKRHSIP